MSGNIEVKKLVDVRVDGSAAVSAVHDTILGPANLVQQSFTTNSSSSSNLDFVIQTPGLGVYTSRKVWVQVDYPMVMTVTSAPSIGPTSLVWGTHFGPCALPLNSLITSATVQISTSNFTTQVQQSLPYIKRRLQAKDARAELADIPCLMGETVNIVSPLDAPTTTQMFGPVYDGEKVHNASYAQWFWTDQNGNIAASQAAPVLTRGTISSNLYGILRIYEPLFIQPFEWDDDKPCFTNTNLINIRLNLSQPTAAEARILRFVADTVVGDTGAFVVNSLGFNSSASTLLQNAQVRATFYTPPAGSEPPSKAIFPTMFINPLATPCNATTFPARDPTVSPQIQPQTVYSQVITLNTAPDMLAIYFVPFLSAYTDVDNSGAGVAGIKNEDFVFPIQSLEVSWNNNPSLLATFDQRELWRRTYANGLKLPYHVFSGIGQDSRGSGGFADGTIATVGSPVLLALNKDIPVELGVAAGVAGVYTLKIKANVYNQTSVAVTGGTFYVVPITSQYLSLITGATSDVVQTVTTEKVVLQQPVSGTIQDKEFIGAGMHVGGAISASSRSSTGVHRMLDMVHRGGALTSGGAGAAALVGAKRPHYDL